MNRFLRFDLAWICRVHPVPAGLCEFTVLRAILPADNSIVLNQKPSTWHSHPTILAAMVVNLTLLSRFPTNRKHFVEVRFLDQVAGIVRLSKKDIPFEAAGIDWMLLQKLMHPIKSKLRFAHPSKF